ncbi:MAG: hypothetical protein F9K46_07255 [Anaerolineae bacterium]|nr:MAG: hypothetical protein F9K46_07255 [Anaerolineae bacterium]
MEIDWNTTELPAQLAKYPLQPIEAVTVLVDKAEVGIVKVTLQDLAGYVESWGIKAGVWLVLAVVKMLTEIVEDYRVESSLELPMIGCRPPAYFEIAVPTEQEQELCHRILTAYNEIYAVMLRTQRQSGSPIWHRRSTVQYFPRLVVEGSGTELTE